jgi:hypothetical protein
MLRTTVSVAAGTLGKDEVDQAFAVFANFSLDALFEVGKLCPFGLAHVLSRDLRPARPAPCSAAGCGCTPR